MLIVEFLTVVEVGAVVSVEAVVVAAAPQMDFVRRNHVEAAFQEDNLDIESLLEETYVVEGVEIH